MPRYFEIIITGRQLAALVVGVALAIAVAFGLGAGVCKLQPAPQQLAAVAPAVPTPVWQPTPPAMPTAAPTPQVVAAPLPTFAPSPIATERARAAAPAAAAKAAPRWVQVAALGKFDQAEGVRNRVVALGYTTRQVLVQTAPGRKFRVRVGPFPDVESAGRVAARLRAEGFGGAFVVNE